MKSFETYTLGYSTTAVDFMARRTLETHAAFVIPRLEPGLHVLDCGCGPGTMTLGLASRVQPGLVIAIDQEISQLEIARQNARAQGISNVRFERASIYELPYADGQFDLVFTHAVFEHLKETAAALHEVHRVLKKGGSVALRSPDWGGFLYYPNLPMLDEALEYYKMLQGKNGGDVCVGRKLKSLLLAGGFDPVVATATYETIQPLEIITELIARRIEGSVRNDQAIERGWTTETKLQGMTAALRQLNYEPGGFFALAWCEVLGTKA